MIGGSKNRTYGDVLEAERETKSNDPCSFSEAIQLQRVEPAQLKGLQRGQHLTLKTHTENNVTSLICVRHDNKKYLGSVAFSGVDKLIECIKKKRKYNVTVVAIAGAAVEIEIHDA